MKVLKFGGTSIGSAENIKKAAEIIRQEHEKGEQLAIVLSATSGVTNKLLEISKMAAESDDTYTEALQEIEEIHFELVKQIIDIQYQSQLFAQIKLLTNELHDLLSGVYLLKELSYRILDLIQSFGERLSTVIFSQYLTQSGVFSEALDARKIILTDDNFGSARVNFQETDKNIRNYFKERDSVQVVTGFISSTEKGETTTLGRGGSDYTASILASALDADLIEIWSDVDGVMTADPKRVPKAFSLPAISYIEAMEMSHFGAKVIYPPTIHPAYQKNIPIRIRNTFNPDFPGTLISNETDKQSYLVKGISSIENINLINIQGSGMVGVPGVSGRLFGALSRAGVNVILITQASSEFSICFAVVPSQADTAKKTIQEEFAPEISSGQIDRIHVEKNLSILAIIGENMRNTPGIADQMFGGLARNGINVVAIAQGSSELNLSVVINNKDLSKALNSLHEAFFLSDTRSLNLFVVGVGLIGSTLLDQIRQQEEFFKREKALNINIIALANSKKMLFDKQGLNTEQWENELKEKGESMNIGEYVRQMKELNLPNSVMVDNTSSEEVIKHYEEVLESSISIVTPNKLANSGSFEDYQRLQKAAYRNGARLMYETNVGAGLPVISTLRDLLYSGDTILKIEGVFSGSLSYIFNTFSKGMRFSDVVKEARDKGFTEPDPRDDLEGMDVGRKLLILARETGLSMELDDLQIDQILPEPCQKAESVDEFFKALEENDEYFDKMLEEAEQEGKVLRFMALLENGEARVSLQAVDSNHPFYSLSGSDNMIAFTTERYKECPLVIKGPGAGAEVTAAGVFAEIISISNTLS